jgi:DNA-binding LacI/PurR family transcriptional regulator
VEVNPIADLARLEHELRAEDPAPSHRRFQLAIQAQLLDGTLVPNDAIPAERLLHAHLRISRSTIRHALQNLIAAGMLRSVRGAGTFVVERRPTRRDRDLVGVIAPDSDFYLYYADLATTLGAGLRAAGLRVDMSIHDNRPDTLADIVGSLLEQQVVAVVLTVRTGPRVEELVERLREQRVVVVLLSRYVDNSIDLDYVGADNEWIGYEATRHLIQLGHAGIVHFAGTDSSTGHDRGLGYVRAMRAAKLAPLLVARPGEAGLAPAELAEYVLGEDADLVWPRVMRREITAAFCFNDARASWVQKEIRSLNLVVPRDLSLVGVDNMPYTAFFDAPLTTFGLPGAEIGRAAANLVIQRLNGDTAPPQRLLLPAQFIQRRSSTVPPEPADTGRAVSSSAAATDGTLA